MRYTVERTTQFKRSLKRCIKQGLDVEKLKTVIRLLADNGSLPTEYSPHKLSGKYSKAWEYHIEPDWLLIWKQNDTELTLILLETGSHAYIFG